MIKNRALETAKTEPYDQSRMDQINSAANLLDAVDSLPKGRTITITRTRDDRISVDGPWESSRKLDLAIRLGRRAE